MRVVGKRERVGLALALAIASAFLLAACGGGEKQDANEEEGTWKVDVLSASFPGRQRLSDHPELRITVKNVDDRTLPNLAVSVDGFNSRKESGNISDPNRPIWVIDEGPEGAGTAFTNTWSVGPVPAGGTRTLVWKVSAVRAGTYTLRFRVGAGLQGKAKAELPDGSAPAGSFIARVSDKTHPINLN